MKKEIKDKLIKKRINNSLYSKDAIIEFLEKQASEGYMLEKVVGSAYYFRKFDPCKVKFTVHVFGKASIYDTIPAKTTEEFIAFCEAAGWNYICANGKVQYFYTEDRKVTPIETDPKEELKNLNRTVFIPTLLIMLICPMIIFLSNIYLWITSEYFCAVDVFISYSPVYNIMFIGLGLIWLLEFIKFIVFNSKNKKSIASGEGLVYFSKKTEKYNLIITIALGVLIVLGYIITGVLDSKVSVFVSLLMIIIFMLIVGVIMAIKKYSKLSRLANIMLNIGLTVGATALTLAIVTTVVIYSFYTDTPLQKNEKRIEYYDKDLKRRETTIIKNDKLPIMSKELGYLDKNTKYVDSWCDKYKTLFGEFYKCEEIQYNKNMEQFGYILDYKILKTNVNFIKDSYINMIVKDEYGSNIKKDTSKEAKKWKANKVYLLDYTEWDGSYNSAVIVYDDMVLYIECAGEDYIQNNIDLICKKISDL